MKYILNIAVPNDVADRFDKKYTDPWGEQHSLSALSEAVDNPSLKASAPNFWKWADDVLSQARDEITAAVKKSVLKPSGQYDSFTAYLEALRTLYNAVVDRQAELTATVEQERENYRLKSPDAQSELAVALLNDAKQKAEEAYQAGLQQLSESTTATLNSLHADYENFVRDFYTPNGDRIDTADQKLLQSGLILSENELQRMIAKHSNNPTMIRILSDYMRLNKINSPDIAPFDIAAQSGGSAEMEIFSRCENQLRTIASGSDVTREVWKKGSPFYDDMIDSCTHEMNDIPVKPAF